MTASRTRPAGAPGVVGVLGLVALALVVGLAVLVGHAAYTPRSAAMAELASALVSLVATVLLAGAARRTSGRMRSSWAALALGMALWGASLLVLDVTCLLTGRAHGMALATVLQGLAAVLVLVTLPLQPREAWRPGVATRTRLDVAVIVLSLMLIFSVVIARHVVRVSDEALRGFALSYPVAALGLAAFAYILCRRGTARPRPDQVLLVVGFGCFVLSGSTYAMTATRIDVSPPVVSLVFSCGVVAVALAARAAGRPGVVPAVSERSARVLTSLPEALVVLAVLIGMARGLQNWVDWSLAALTGTAIFVRSARLSAQARVTRQALEDKVQERTHALARLTDQHTRILATVDDGIVGVDGEDRITFVNAAAARFLGLVAEDVLGLGVCEALCAQEHDICPLCDDGLSRSLRVETAFRTARGTHLPVDVTVARRSDPTDGTASAVIAFRDLTEQQRVEQVKRQFVSSVSHELRTPLTSIRGVLEMLADGDVGPLPDEAHLLLQSAQRGGERLSRLVDDIIDMERLAAGDFGVAPSPHEVDALVLRAIASIERVAAAQGVDVRIGAVSGVADCDPDRVEQALVNLIGNAVKFSPSGSTVLVSSVPREDDVLVTVRDHGRGIPPADLPHVFDRFHQVSVPDATDKGGSGLGLTITRAIVERHGGRIWVESEVGIGTVFSFTLPVPVPAQRTPGDGDQVPAGAWTGS